MAILATSFRNTLTFTPCLVHKVHWMTGAIHARHAPFFLLEYLKGIEMKLNVFTWNMQRGSSIVPAGDKAGKIRAAARKELLDYLCRWGDVGFITEAGKDLVAAVATPGPTSTLLPEGIGNWTAAIRADGQKGISDCKSLVFRKDRLTPVHLPFKSGGKSAFRYAAVGAAKADDDPRILFIAIHATSGGGGWENSSSLFDFIEEKSGRSKGFHVIFAGGDMNSNHSYFDMPKTATHQSGSILDGFMYEFTGEEHEVDVFAKPTVLHQHGICELRSVKSSSIGSSAPAAAAVAASSSVSVAPSVSSDDISADSDEEVNRPIGYFCRGIRVSDHAPVWAVYNINRKPPSTEEMAEWD